MNFNPKLLPGRSSVASRRQHERCDVTYALLPTVAKLQWLPQQRNTNHRNFATVGNNAYVTSQRSPCLRDATDDHFLSLIVDPPFQNCILRRNESMHRGRLTESTIGKSSLWRDDRQHPITRRRTKTKLERGDEP